MGMQMIRKVKSQSQITKTQNIFMIKRARDFTPHGKKKRRQFFELEKRLQEAGIETWEWSKFCGRTFEFFSTYKVSTNYIIDAIGSKNFVIREAEVRRGNIESEIKEVKARLIKAVMGSKCSEEMKAELIKVIIET